MIWLGRQGRWAAVAILGLVFFCDMASSATQNGDGRDAPTLRNSTPQKTELGRLPAIEYRKAVPVDDTLKAEVVKSATQIDRLVLKKLKEEKIRPRGMTNDMQFARRAYLDITGMIPTARQLEDFLRRARTKDKRSQLIDELLSSTGYVSHSFNYWADLLRLKDRPRGNVYSQPYHDWIKDVLAQDVPYDDFVRQMLTARGRVWEDPAAGYELRDAGMALSNLDLTVRLFLGTRIGCAQCHDHPFDRWTQKEFYQLAAFVHGVDYNADRREVDQATRAARQEIQQLAEKNEDKKGLPGRVNRLLSVNRAAVGDRDGRKLRLPHDYQYDNGKPGEVVEPQVIFGSLESSPGDSKRVAFAKWLTSEQNPRFTLTIVNRLWQRVFGRGLIEPVDELTDESKPVNQELMDFLNDEMKRVHYRQREFLRILYNTQTYQRLANDRDIPLDQPYYFPGPVLRRMSAEQVWDSLLTLTVRDPDVYQRPSLKPLVDELRIDTASPVSANLLLARIDSVEKVKRKGPEAQLKKQFTHKGVLLVRASEMPLPLPPSHFLRQFGQSDRESLAGGNTDGHVPQILTMFNGPISHKLLNEGTVIYDEVMHAGSPRDQVDVIFYSILGRKPTRNDYRLAAQEIEANGAAGYGNVIWALLNTREFLFIQ